MNENQQTALVAVLGGTAFFVGMLVGDRLARKAIYARFEAKKALIGNGLVSAVSKALEQNMTKEEFQAELDSELDFIKIVEG